VLVCEVAEEDCHLQLNVHC